LPANELESALAQEDRFDVVFPLRVANEIDVAVNPRNPPLSFSRPGLAGKQLQYPRHKIETFRQAERKAKSKGEQVGLF
jgi:hypothetical protein